MPFRLVTVVTASFIATVLSLVCYPFSSHAFYSVHETGDLLKPEQMQIGGELQLITNNDEGVDLVGRFDKGFDEDRNLRFEVGTGTTDFFLGGYVKWVPYPDFEKQPALGVNFGAHYAHYESNNELTLRAIPFASKKIESTDGDFTPYVSLPLGLGTYDDDSVTPLQIVFGTRYHHPDFAHCDFSAELGIELNDAPTYFSISAIFPAFE